MNPKWFGDSFDIVKWFFIANIRETGYQVFVDPMLTGQLFTRNSCNYVRGCSQMCQLLSCNLFKNSPLFLKYAQPNLEIPTRGFLTGVPRRHA